VKTAGLFCSLSLVALAGCCTASNPCIKDISAEQLASLKAALSREHFSTAPITKCFHRHEDPAGDLYVATADGGRFIANYAHAKWKIFYRVIVTG
jgi:hypothetical protein